MGKTNKYTKRLIRRVGHFYENIERFIAYRTYDKYNVIKIKTLDPAYYDKDQIMLHGMFALLVDYVEVELASMDRVADYINRIKSLKNFLYNLLVPDFIKYPPSSDRGLSHLDYYRTYKGCSPDEEQFAESTRQFGEEVFSLYKWWTVERPLRKDPMDLSGFSDFCDQHRGKLHKFKLVRPELCYGETLYEMYDELTEEERKLEKKLLDDLWKIEEEQNKEDEDMLIRLIKLRRSLWT